MIAVSRDAVWTARLGGMAARGGWPFVAVEAVPVATGEAPRERAAVVLDRAAADRPLPRAVAALRALFPAARVALACSEQELGADGVAAGVASGADDVLSKSWSDRQIFSRLAALRDAALAAEVLVSADGTLKAERRSRRVFARARGGWAAVALPGPEFGLLWRLLESEGEAVSRERLWTALRRAVSREVEVETVSRRVLSLRRALAPRGWVVTAVRGGFYRLEPSRRRSST